VQDVASVYLGYAQQAKKSFVMDAQDGESQNALSFQVKKAPGYSVESFVATIKTTVDTFALTTPRLKYVETLSQAESIQQTYGLFLENFWETAFLVFIIILLFL
jgi:multidrug efflux pump subunit AcrB